MMMMKKKPLTNRYYYIKKINLQHVLIQKIVYSSWNLFRKCLVGAQPGQNCVSMHGQIKLVGN